MSERICKDSPESSRDRERSCKNCKHYHITTKDGKATRGDCRIYPPKQDAWNSLDYWPQTGGSSFCGGFKERETHDTNGSYTLVWPPEVESKQTMWHCPNCTHPQICSEYDNGGYYEINCYKCGSRFNLTYMPSRK